MILQVSIPLPFGGPMCQLRNQNLPLPPSLRLRQLAFFEATSRQLATFRQNATVSFYGKETPWNLFV